MITFYIHRTVHGWEYPWLRTAFHWFPRDKKDRKDSRNSGRLNTCNLPPSELTSHTLLWRVMEWTNSGIMSGSIESNLRRNAHSHAQMPCGGIMGSIMRWTVPMGRFQKTPGFPGIAPIKNSGAVIGEVGFLCAEFERIAFTTGPKLRAQLMVELTENVTREWEIKVTAHGGDIGLDHGRFYDYVIA